MSQLPPLSCHHRIQPIKFFHTNRNRLFHSVDRKLITPRQRNTRAGTKDDLIVRLTSEIFVSLPGMAEITRPIFDLHLLLPSPPSSSSGRITFFSQPNKGKPDGLTLLQQNFYIYIYIKVCPVTAAGGGREVYVQRFRKLFADRKVIIPINFSRPVTHKLFKVR